MEDSLRTAWDQRQSVLLRQQQERRTSARSTILCIATAISAFFLVPPAGVGDVANFEILRPSEEVQITRPQGSLTRGDDGAFYGVGAKGGGANLGGVFRITPEGEYRTIASITDSESGGLRGGFPLGTLTRASDGRLYGAAGFYNPAAFYVTPGENATATHLADFADLGIPTSSASEFVEASDGRLYGITSSRVIRINPGSSPSIESVATFYTGRETASVVHPLSPAPNGRLYGFRTAGSNNGVIIEVTPGDTVAVQEIATFSNTAGLLPGRTPTGRLQLASDGKLYGVTTSGGASGFGTIFAITPGNPSTVATVASFTGATGALPGSTPIGMLTEGSDGRIYGVTVAGGNVPAGADGGTIFRITPGATLSVESVTTFTGAAGAGLRGGAPGTGLIAGPDGKLYGTSLRTETGGVSTVYRVTPGETPQVEHLVDFDAVTSPTMPLVRDAGKLYGFTTAGNGTAYVINPSDDPILRTLTAFTYPVKEFSDVRLARGKDGAFYGFTEKGKLFRVGPDGTYEQFEDGLSSVPNMPLTLGSDGRFYATVEDDDFYGSVISIDLDTEPRIQRIATFSGSAFSALGGQIQGRDPRCSLTEAPDGRLYGVTSGRSGLGTVFVVTPGDHPSVAHVGPIWGDQISGNRADKPLTLAADGRLYSTTYYGGTADAGTVFRVTPGPSPTVRMLASFTGLSGALPGSASYAKLYAAPDGHLYGATTMGGAANAGTLFRINPADQAIVTSVASFTGATGALPGFSPWEAPTPADDGYYYGATGGSSGGRSTIYRLLPGEQPVVEHLLSLTGSDGEFPGDNVRDPLVQGADGKIYGAGIDGGSQLQGVLFRFTPGADPEFETVVHFGSGVTGIDPDSHLLRLPNGTFYGVTNSSIFRVRFDTPPVLLDVAQPATGVTVASIAADVYPSESMTDVRLEYGEEDQFEGVQNMEDIGEGTLEQRLNFSLSGLQPHTTYHYRVVAENGFGTVTSETRSFTTANSIPAAGDDFILSNGQAITADVSANDTDADGDALEISQVIQPAFGTVTWEGTTITYTPGAGYLGRDLFTYTISDGFGGTNTAEVHIYSDRPLSRSLLQTGITFTGLTGPLKSFDGFAFSAREGQRFVGLAKAGTGKRVEQVVIGAEPVEVLLPSGAEVPGLSDVLISKFRGLVGNALLTDFKRGKGVSTKNDTAILALDEDGTRVVVREDDDAVGIPDAKFAAFTSIDWGRGTVFAAKVKGRGISAQNDNGIWAETDSGLRLVCRERQDIFAGGVEKRVKSIAALLASTNNRSFASGCATNGLLVFRVTFTDKSHAILRFDCSDPDSGLGVLAATGDPVPNETGTAYVEFGLPVCADDGSIAFRAAARATGSGAPVKVQGVVLDGAFHTTDEEASNTIVPVSDPVVGLAGRSAVMVNLIGGKPRKIPAVVSVSENGLEVLASAGDAAPGVDGAEFQRFAQLGILPERGVIFAGLLAQKKGVVNAGNRNGIWAQDSRGDLSLLLRTGQSLTVDGIEEQVQSFQLLSAGGGAGSEAFGEDGSLVCVVKFKGGLQRVMQFRVP